ncbi:MAG: methylated-DNA--[protein]-cysteine S-methyltransferase [Ignavibacteriales bacterium]|nr:methylated-DNA--[protein]-cysteine S-methyltransferase [Ignavibacteriales bacterium]
METAYYQSEIGLIRITSENEYITSLDFVENKTAYSPTIPDSLKECITQLDEYFKGKRKEFTLKLKVEGTEFQKSVWNELQKIPYGKTVSYQDVATAIGKKRAVRAVGSANGKNKIAIIIPCHRVISSDGNLSGYASGVWRKEWLIKHEKNFNNNR